MIFIRNKKLFSLALALSFAIHGAALLIKLSSPEGVPGQSKSQINKKITVALQPKASPEKAIPSIKKSKTRPTNPTQQRRSILAVKKSSSPSPSFHEPERTWTPTEKNEMNQFLNELAEEAKPLKGRALAQRARAMARSMPAPSDEVSEEEIEIATRLAEANVQPFSLAMYYDALTRKLNRSAEMVKNETKERGVQVAAVRVTLNKDGSMRSFKILQAADQKEEIAYINAIVKQASPFAAFPPEIRNATNKLILDICILPSRYNNGGAQFTPMEKGRGCRVPS